jgi:myo-inositol 2-dehydrogenase / D-chiro-inositol 1-dehydrogenase
MRLCVVGCGEHANSSHGPAQKRYAAEHPEVVLAGCCDVDRPRAEAYRARFGFERAYDDVDRMVSSESPDAVVVVVPEGKTVEVAAPLLERGAPVLLEKPPGRTVAEVDCLIAAAEARGKRAVPHLVAFNRRFAPLVRELRVRLDALGGSDRIHHVHYEMTRVDRRDPDFSVTAIHGIDAVRFISGSDYAHARFRYQERPELGPGVANIFIDATMASGATAHLAFCPVAGVVAERAVVETQGHTFFLHVPMWGAFDSPGRLQHLAGGALVADATGGETGDGTSSWELGGFFAEYEAFLGALAAGRTPSPSLREARQSVAVSEHIRERRSEYSA